MMPAVFFIISLFVSTSGFGGGSFYLSILTLADLPFRLIPFIALVCNIIVVGSSVMIYFRRGLVDHSTVLLFCSTSIPAAFLGALIPIDRAGFYLAIGLLLLAALILMHWRRRNPLSEPEIRPLSPAFCLPAGALLGLAAGLTGIGGGILLSPLLLLFSALPKDRIAALSAAFILLNSLSGLTGQFLRYSGVPPEFSVFLLLFPVAVLAGGQIGTRIGISFFGEKHYRSVLSLIMVFAMVNALKNAIP